MEKRPQQKQTLGRNKLLGLNWRLEMFFFGLWKDKREILVFYLITWLFLIAKLLLGVKLKHF